MYLVNNFLRHHLYVSHAPLDQHNDLCSSVSAVPYTRYTVWLNAKTGKHEGVSSERLSLRTDVGAPSAPELQNVSCRADTSVFLEWRRPRVVHGSIDSYHVLYRQHRDAVFQVASIPTSYSVRREQVRGQGGERGRI